MNVARLLVAFCLAFCAVAARAGTAGQVMFAYGETHALRAGRIVHLIAGASVESGDQLHTGADSYLQVRFTDWGVMSLRPRTDFVIDEYEYEQRQGGIERAFFSLIAGGVRSLTGLIGHRDRSHYRLRTRMTAIGIRGTHYSVLLCQQDCRNEDGSLGEDGVYGGVIEGRIAVSPYGGTALEREFGAGEYFRLADENSIPMPLFTPPPFFWDPREPQSRAGGRTFAAVPWKPAPSLPPAAGGDPADTAGPLIRTDGSLTLSPITSPLLSAATPVLSQAGTQLGSTVNALVAPVAPVLGSTLGSVVDSTALAPVAALAGSTVNSLLGPVAPLTPALGTTLGGVTAPVGAAVGAVAGPVVAPVAPVVAPIAPVVAPVIAPVAPVIAPVIAPVAPVVAPIVSVTPPPPAVTLPSLPTLPVVGGLPSLLPKK